MTCKLRTCRPDTKEITGPAPNRTCPNCDRRARTKGHARRAVLTAAGTVRLARLYLVCPGCHTARYPLDERLGVSGFVSPQAQRLLCLAGSSWSFDRASANLKEFCGLVACDNTIRAAGSMHGGAMRDWQRNGPRAPAAFRTEGWREMRLSIFAKRHRGTPIRGTKRWQQRNLPKPHVQVIQAAIRTGEQLGPGWWRMAVRLGLSNTGAITALADGARWIWNQLAEHLPGAAGVLDIYHASEHLWSAAHAHFGEGRAEAGAWVTRRREALLRGGASARLSELVGPEWNGLRGYFEPHADHTRYADRLRLGQSIGSGLVEGACKQVIARRLKQTGARWKVRRAERMATLCAVQASDQWATYWRHAV